VTDYLTVADVLAMHADQIERYGGALGVRDPGQLEAALYRSQTGYYADLIEEAAAVWESLSLNHPFIDGNKRAAFVCMGQFLADNGMTLVADPRDAADIFLALAAGELDVERLAEWLRRNVQIA